jgi:hypothetical protein
MMPYSVYVPFGDPRLWNEGDWLRCIQSLWWHFNCWGYQPVLLDYAQADLRKYERDMADLIHASMGGVNRRVSRDARKVIKMLREVQANKATA